MKKKEAPPSKKGPGKAVKKVVNEFAYGLVGSDVEVPNFDPLQLSAGRSEETVNWYRAAELKVCLNLYLNLHLENRRSIAVIDHCVIDEILKINLYHKMHSTAAFACLPPSASQSHQLSTSTTQYSTPPLATVRDRNTSSFSSSSSPN